MNEEEYEYFIEGEQVFGSPFVLEQRLRSRIIYNAILVDNVIEKIITTHFCRKKDEEMLFASLIFRDGQITFLQKTIILRKLIEAWS